MFVRRGARFVALGAFLFATGCGDGSILSAERADPSETGVDAGRSIADAAADGAIASRGDATVGRPATSWTGMRVGTNFWFLASWAEDAWADGASFNSDNPWNPTFLADLDDAGYSVFRFMDWGGTNNATIRAWSERTQKTSAQNREAGDVGGRGIAYEWMFDLCNRLQTDCWITVPHLAIESYEADPGDNYFTALARLAREQLDPSLALYVEYSNETWNAGFEQARYSQRRGTELGLDGDAYAASFKFHVYASSRMYGAFVDVFGEDSARLRWVVSGQLSSNYGTQAQVAALADPNTNPGLRTPHFYAISNYVGSGGGIDGSAGDVEAQFRAGIDEMIGWAREQKATVAATGMKFIAYEGGQHITRGAASFSRNPAAYDLYRSWLDRVATLYDLTVHYGFSGSYDDTNAWGSKERVGQPLSDTPKARALRDWIRAQP